MSRRSVQVPTVLRRVPPIALLVWWTVAPLMAGDTESPPSAWELFRPPEIQGVRLSPDGRRIAYGQKTPSAEEWVIQSLPPDVPATRRRPTASVADGMWAGNRVWVTLSAHGALEAWWWETGNTVTLMPARTPGRPGPPPPVHVLGVVGDPVEALLVAGDPKGRGTDRPDVFRIDLATGQATPIARNTGRLVHWVADASGTVRLARQQSARSWTWLHRARNSDPWQVLLSGTMDDSVPEPAGFSAEGRFWQFLRDPEGDGKGLFQVDTTAPSHVAALWQRPGVDVDRVVTDPVTQTAIGVIFEDVRERSEFLDPEWADWQTTLDALHPDRVQRPLQVSVDRRRALVWSHGDRHPGRYLVQDRNSGEVVTEVDPRPALNRHPWAASEPVTFPTRGGRELPGYLTLPVHGPRTLRPLVVFPHGGPWDRSRWAFDPYVQFLASRGYAVLRPNFRGSSGYGSRFLEAGFQEWGLGMQDDITDAVQWAIAEGIADPERVAIFGVSYGGYAAMMGLARTPDLYRCGVSLQGVTDLSHWVAETGRRHPSERRFLTRAIGPSGFRSQALRDVSPIHLVHLIQAPVLIGWSGRDDRIDPRDNDRFVRALRESGGEVEAVFAPNAGHDLTRRDDIEAFFGALEEFLGRHLQPRSGDSELPPGGQAEERPPTSDPGSSSGPPRRPTTQCLRPEPRRRRSRPGR